MSQQFPIKSSQKIFSLGLTKTGTTSLHHALTTLKIKSTHSMDHARAIDKSIREGKLGLSTIPNIQAVTGGTVWHQHLQILDQQYPGSKFILPVRNINDWLISIKRHTIKHNQSAKIARLFDPDQLRQQYHDHVSKVKKYFEQRPQDLLILNVTGGEGYEKLCPFLGIPIRRGKFPHKNSLKRTIRVYSL